MAQTDEVAGTAEEPAVVSAVRSGGADAFSSLTEPYRRELRAHCYRMAGNLDDAEDLVQDTLLRAWRSRSCFEGRSSLRAWLYRITMNVCLDAIKRTRRRVGVLDAPPGPGRAPSFDEVPWLQPFPDRLLEDEVSGGEEPEAAVGTGPIGGERLDLLGRPLPPCLEVRVVVLPSGARLGYEPAVWRGALLEVDCGEIDIEFRTGVCGRFGAGTLFWLDGLAPQALYNRGHQPAVLVAVSRRR
jgi:Sigma-70 region 2